MRIVAIVVSLSIAAGCQPRPEETPAQSTAIVMTEIRPGAPLDEMLQHLETEVVLADSGGMEGEAVNHFRRAEAISDRLLEARLPFEWMTAEQYSVQARLRQIQSSADRVLAQVQTNAPREEMLRNLSQLRRDVSRLREAISRGGGRAPTPLERLLADSATQTVPRVAPARTARPDTAGTTTGGD